VSLINEYVNTYAIKLTVAIGNA